MRYWRSLDGVRAFAVLVVFAGHVRWTPLHGGFVGVDVFFVLSGFLITGLLLREHKAEGDVSLRAFYTRRFLRLYPALVFFCIAVIPMAALSHEVTVHQTAIQAAAALTYSFNILISFKHWPSIMGHLWSLSVEEQYYILWAPLAALLFSRLGVGRRMGRCLAAFVVGGWCVLALVTAIWGTGGVNLAYYHLHGHLVELFTGGLLAWIVLAGVPETMRRIVSNPLAPLVALGVLLAAAWKVGTISSPLMLVVYPVLALMSATLIAHLVVSEGGWASRVFGHPVARWLGKRSYAFYLFHLPILDLVEEHTSHMKVAILVALPLSLLAAEVSWRLVEAPALRRKTRFQRVPTGQAPATA